MTVWGVLIASLIPKATNKHSEYLIIINFPQQQWLHERASILRNKYVDCLVIKKKPKCTPKSNVNNSMCGEGTYCVTMQFVVACKNNLHGISMGRS